MSEMELFEDDAFWEVSADVPDLVVDEAPRDTDTYNVYSVESRHSSKV